MLLPKKEDTYHKIQLIRLLTEILDSEISKDIYFKGGTAATMLGFLDRFSLDLDFDLSIGADKKKIDKVLRMIFQKLDFKIEKKAGKTLFYVLKYPSKPGLRNSLKLSIVDKALKSNQYDSFYLPDVDRFAICQTKETMFAHKLVAATDRYKKYQTIAGRDLYDIHYFFLQGYEFNSNVIIERTGKKPKEYLKELADFIEKKVNDKIINEDLSFLLPYERFKTIRKVLKREVVMMLRGRI
ncbi:MAG: nucleotidyl transferase AbiEii/AbiGii toxin family protein [Patescibacteria group bacterium]|nr:nucleotidyl transferase AbiEii/AbiGii toxin family protein [Patescibacteria group bacterium]